MPFARRPTAGEFGELSRMDMSWTPCDRGATAIPARRVIEVKSGSIELTETEVRAAELRGARYFIYRIAFDDASRDSADLTMLADPLAYRQALLARYEFRIDAVGDRQRYQLQAAFDSEAEEQEALEMAADVGI